MKWVCLQCGGVCEGKDALVAQNPFSPQLDKMSGCPVCYEPCSLRICCEEIGCLREATTGRPDKGTYRSLCSSHFLVKHIDPEHHCPDPEGD